jgi:hypothetical protein
VFMLGNLGYLVSFLVVVYFEHGILSNTFGLVGVSQSRRTHFCRLFERCAFVGNFFCYLRTDLLSGCASRANVDRQGTTKWCSLKKVECCDSMCTVNRAVVLLVLDSAHKRCH